MPFVLVWTGENAENDDVMNSIISLPRRTKTYRFPLASICIRFRWIKNGGIRKRISVPLVFAYGFLHDTYVPINPQFKELSLYSAKRCPLLQPLDPLDQKRSRKIRALLQNHSKVSRGRKAEAGT